jgi:parallel beta helix pectate lyase-like protein
MRLDKMQIKNLITKLLFTILFSVITSANAESQYSMPIGIPDTTVNFTQSIPARPNSWNIEYPGYYYINYSTGSDSLSYGNEMQPRKTLPKIIPAGSYIEIEGEYFHTSGGVIKVYGEGTSAPWVANTSGAIWLTSSPKSQGSFINAKSIVWGSHVFVTNFTIKQNSKIQVGSSSTGFPADNIVIRNSNFIGTLEMGNGALLSVLGAESTPSSNVVLYKNLLRDAGDITNETDVDAEFIVINGYSSHVWALENIGHTASGSALQINARPPRSASHHIYAGKNEFYNVRQAGLWVKYATNVVFSSNYVHDIISTPWSPAKGLGGQYEPNGLWIINNIIHDVEYAVRIPSTNSIKDLSLNVYILGNVIYDVHTKAAVGTSSAWESAGIHIQGANKRIIANNLIYNTPNGINVSTTSGETYIENNIILKVNNNHPIGQQGYHIWAENQALQPELTITNNFFGLDNMNIKLKSKLYNTTYNLDQYLNAGNQYEVSTNFSGNIDIATTGMNNIVADGLTNKELWDFGKKIYTDLSNKLSTNTGINLLLNKDILGAERVQGASVDIGPFEQAGFNPDIYKPNKPENLQIDLK